MRTTGEVVAELEALGFQNYKKAHDDDTYVYILSPSEIYVNFLATCYGYWKFSYSDGYGFEYWKDSDWHDIEDGELSIEAMILLYGNGI